jgi:hypothetical protein
VKSSLLIRFVIAITALAATCGILHAQEQPSGSDLARRFARHFDDRPPVMFELETAADHPGRILITNTYQYPLTALAIELSGEPGSKFLLRTHLYDAFTRSQLLAPVPRGLTFTAFAGHVVGGQIPNARLAAAIWEDGTTFGSENVLNQLLEARRVALSAFDHVLRILAAGIDSGWTAAQFLSALEVATPPNLAPITMEQAQVQTAGDAVAAGTKLTISSLASNGNLDRGIKALERNLKQQRDLLADSAPALSANSSASRK